MEGETLKHHWPRLKVQVQRRWPRLTDDDLVAIDGDHEYLIEALVARYDYDEPQAEREWRTFAGGVGNGHDSVLAELKHSASEAIAPGAQKIREGFAEIGLGLKTLAGDARFAGRERIDAAIESVKGATAGTADRGVAELTQSAGSALQKAEQFVRERPFAALGIAFVAGWLILGRR